MIAPSALIRHYVIASQAEGLSEVAPIRPRRLQRGLGRRILLDHHPARVVHLAKGPHEPAQIHAAPAEVAEDVRAQGTQEAETVRRDRSPCTSRRRARPPSPRAPRAPVGYPRNWAGARSEGKISGIQGLGPCPRRSDRGAAPAEGRRVRSRATIAASGQTRPPARLRGRSHGRSPGCSVSVNVTFSTQSSPSHKTSLTAAARSTQSIECKGVSSACCGTNNKRNELLRNLRDCDWQWRMA